MFINFKKYDWEECVRRLMTEVNNICGAKNTDKPKNENKKSEPVTDNKENTHSNQNHETTNNHDISTNHPQSQYYKRLSREKIKKVVTWSEIDIQNWFNEKKFNPNLIDTLKPDVNGKILFQMFQILQSTPEFFYTSLRTDSNNKLFLKDIAMFSFELNALFEDNEF